LIPGEEKKSYLNLFEGHVYKLPTELAWWFKFLSCTRVVFICLTS